MRLSSQVAMLAFARRALFLVLGRAPVAMRMHVFCIASICRFCASVRLPWYTTLQ